MWWLIKVLAHLGGVVAHQEMCWPLGDGVAHLGDVRANSGDVVAHW